MKKYYINKVEIEKLKFYQKLDYNYIVLINNDLLLSEKEPLCETLPYGGMNWIGQGKWQHVIKNDGFCNFLSQNQCISISELLMN